MFGMADINEFATKDNQFKITRIIGEALFGSFLIIMVIIAVNMLIAMMSRSYEAVAVSQLVNALSHTVAVRAWGTVNSWGERRG